MDINRISEQLKNVYSKINKVVKLKYDGYQLILSWLLQQKEKAAVLFIFDFDEKKSVYLLSDLNGNIIYQHEYNNYYSDSYYGVFDFFDNCCCTESMSVNIDKTEKEKHEKLIADTTRYLDFLFKYCKHYEWIAEILENNCIKQVNYICSIFKLNHFYNDDPSDVQTNSFYLRYGIMNEKNQIISYYDIEFLPEENDEYSCVDDYILDVVFD